MLEDDIKNAFSSPEQLREAYKQFPDDSCRGVIFYYENYRRGILDTMANYPQIVPPKVKKILANAPFINNITISEALSVATNGGIDEMGEKRVGVNKIEWYVEDDA